MHDVVCRATRLPDVTSMRPSDLRKELSSYGISTHNPMGREQLIEEVIKARSEGVQQPYINTEQSTQRNGQKFNNYQGPKVRIWPNTNGANPSSTSPNPNTTYGRSVNTPPTQQRPTNTAASDSWKPHAYMDDYSIPRNRQQQAQYFQQKGSPSTVNGDVNYKTQQRKYRPQPQYQDPQQYNGPYYNANIRDAGINDGTHQYNYRTERQKFNGNTYIPKQQAYPPPYQEPYHPPNRRPHMNEPNYPNQQTYQQRYQQRYQPPYQPPFRKHHMNEPPRRPNPPSPAEQYFRRNLNMNNNPRYQQQQQQTRPPPPPYANGYPRQPQQRYQQPPRQPSQDPYQQKNQRPPPPQTPQQRHQERQRQYQQFQQSQQFQQPYTSTNPPNDTRQWNGAMSPDSNSYEKVNNQSWQTGESLHEEILKSFVRNQQEDGDDEDREFFTTESYTDYSKTEERQEMVNKEWLKVQQMDLKDLVEELLELGIAVDEFTEKSQFVKALVNARVENKWKETSDYDENNPWKKPHREQIQNEDEEYNYEEITNEEDYDPSYKDVNLKKMKIKPSSLNFGTSALIDVQISDVIDEEFDENEMSIVQEEIVQEENVEEANVSDELVDDELLEHAMNYDEIGHDVTEAYSEIAETTGDSEPIMNTEIEVE